MKKYIAGLVLVSSFLISAPAMAAGLTEAQIQAIISLVSSFGVDATVVKNVEASLRGQPTTSNTTVPPSTSCITVNNNLYVGSTDAATNGEVSKLQQFLGGRVTGYFGPATQKLVRNWQSAHDLTSNGYIDLKTRITMTQGCDSALPLVNPNQPIVPSASSTQQAQPTSNQPSSNTQNTSTTSSPQITSVNISPTLTSATIEWYTDKPTDSKVFISGNGIASTVYQSQSGISTHHLANITGLSGTNTYSYEIEAVAGGQATKKQGTFATTPDDLVLSLQVDKSAVQLTGWSPVQVTAQFTKNGKVVPVDILFSAPGDSKTYKIVQNWPNCSSPFLVQLVGTDGGTCSTDGKVSYSYLPKVLGTQTITVTAGGVSKSIDISVTPYVKIDPVIQFTDSNTIIPHETGHTIGTFSISAADEPLLVSQISATASGNPINLCYQINNGSSGGSNYFCINNFADNGTATTNFSDYVRISASTSFSVVGGGPEQPGNYTFTITGIKVIGQNSGTLRNVQGLPITFHYTVQ